MALNRVDLAEPKGKKPLCGRCGKEITVAKSATVVSGDLLEKIIRNAQLPVVVDVYADWCGPCKMYAPIFQEVAQKQYARAEFYKLDSERNQAFAAKYGIRGIPATLVFRDGALVKSQSGLLQASQLEQLF